jgi:hypothetical protein
VRLVLRLERPHTVFGAGISRQYRDWKHGPKAASGQAARYRRRAAWPTRSGRDLAEAFFLVKVARFVQPSFAPAHITLCRAAQRSSGVGRVLTDSRELTRVFPISEGVEAETCV